MYKRKDEDAYSCGGIRHTLTKERLFKMRGGQYLADKYSNDCGDLSLEIGAGIFLGQNSPTGKCEEISHLTPRSQTPICL